MAQNGALERVPHGWWLKLAKEIFVKANLDAGADEAHVNALAALLQCTAELIYESKGQPVSAKTVSIVLSQKMLDQVKLLNEQVVNCMAAVAGLALSMPQNLALAKGGPIGITILVANLTLDGLAIWGECNLAVLEMKGAEKVKALEKSLAKRNKHGAMNALKTSRQSWNSNSTLDFMERNSCDLTSDSGNALP